MTIETITYSFPSGEGAIQAEIIHPERVTGLSVSLRSTIPAGAIIHLARQAKTIEEKLSNVIPPAPEGVTFESFLVDRIYAAEDTGFHAELKPWTLNLTWRSPPNKKTANAAIRWLGGLETALRLVLPEFLVSSLAQWEKEEKARLRKSRLAFIVKVVADEAWRQARELNAPAHSALELKEREDYLACIPKVVKELRSESELDWGDITSHEVTQLAEERKSMSRITLPWRD